MDEHPATRARTDNVGADFDEAIALARKVGYTESAIFDQRERSFEAL